MMLLPLRSRIWTLPSWQPAAVHLPSGLNRMLQTEPQSLGKQTAGASSSLPTSQRQILPPSEPVARNRPSGLIATLQTGPSFGVNFLGVSSRMFHMQAVPSIQPVAKDDGLRGWKTTDMIQLL